MKKISARLSLCVVAVIAVMAITFMQSSVYADTYSVDLDEGVVTTVNWGTEYDMYAETYFKIIPSKKGIISFSSTYLGYVSLCDANRKVLSIGSSSSGDLVYSDSSYPYQRKVTYGVQKGKTYYIKVNGMPGSRNEEGKYAANVLWEGKKISPAKFGTKRSKAKAIKRKKTIKGLFVAGNKKAQWYKVTTKNKKTQFYLSAPNMNNGAKITVYYKLHGTSGKMYHVGPAYASRSGYRGLPYLTQARKRKYTAYVKITPDGKSSGYYTLKWK